MKFKVRDGFIVHIKTSKKVADEIVVSENTYPAGETVDLDKASAAGHLHKLEPASKEAADYLASFHVASPASQQAAINHDVLAAAVAATLVAMGVTLPAKPAA